MQKILKLTYHGKVLSKKNSKQIIWNHRTRKPMMISNPSAKANENSMIDEFSTQTLNQYHPIEKCRIRVVIYEPNYQKRDLDNQVTSILDALVSAEVIANDSFKCVTEINAKFGGIDRSDPRAEILIKIEE